MAQFDVYENNSKISKDKIPYLIDIQHNLLEDTKTRVVIPLGIEKPRTNTLNPLFILNNKSYVLMTSFITTIPKYELGLKVCSLDEKRSEIICAIDFLVTGF